MLPPPDRREVYSVAEFCRAFPAPGILIKD